MYTINFFKRANKHLDMAGEIKAWLHVLSNADTLHFLEAVRAIFHLLQEAASIYNPGLNANEKKKLCPVMRFDLLISRRNWMNVFDRVSLSMLSRSCLA